MRFLNVFKIFNFTMVERLLCDSYICKGFELIERDYGAASIHSFYVV